METKESRKWLKDGDRNTKNFHASVRSSKLKNHIEKLENDYGNFVVSAGSMGEIACSYFRKLFESSATGNVTDFFSDFQAKVTDRMNESLTREVTNEEVRSAVFAINSTSAPGFRWYDGLIFQKYWDVVGSEVTKEVFGLFKNGEFPVEWNYTQLFLLPKIVRPTKMVDLRPISLCTVMYKIVSKIIVARLQQILPDIMSPNQSAFVFERVISDNIFIAQEMVNGLRTHPTIPEEFLAVKTDMSKAYDRIEWTYLEALLMAPGFHHIWILWVMFCVKISNVLSFNQW